MMGRPYEGHVPGQYRPSGPFGGDESAQYGGGGDPGGFRGDPWGGAEAPVSPTVAVSRQLRAEQDAAFHASLQVRTDLQQSLD